MRLLQYQVNLRRVRPAFDKIKAAIEADDFRSADVKKPHAGACYRAKLDHTNCLLLQFARVESEGRSETVCLAIELLAKPIVFDDAQTRALGHPAPLVVIGSAGSGKTAVTLARLREAKGGCCT